MRAKQDCRGAILAAVALCCSTCAAAQTTSIRTEYLMSSMSGPLEPGTLLDSSLIIVNVKPGGWIKGPRISGKFVAPCADWVRIMPAGVLRLDVGASASGTIVDSGGTVSSGTAVSSSVSHTVSSGQQFIVASGVTDIGDGFAMDDYKMEKTV